MKQSKLSGIFPALVTPLKADGTVNHAALEQILQRVYSAGVHGVYMCGSTGEGMLLAEATRQSIVETAIQASPAGKQVVVHVGSRSLEESVRLARHAERSGASGVSCIRPTGVTHNEMLDWYGALTAASSLPFLVYYFPASTGEPLNVDQLTAICEMPGVSGIKYTDYDLYTLSLLSRAGYPIFNGRDEVLAAGLLMGACGGIGSIYNLIPAQFVELNSLAARGEWTSARVLQDKINDLIRVLVSFPFLSALKKVLTWEGIECGSAISPGAGLNAAQQTSLRQALTALEIFPSW